jgi:uracil-DNA glycosylase family 4
MSPSSASERRWDTINRGITACELCPRLRVHCRAIAAEKRRAYQAWEYWGKPVPNFGDARSRMLIVGLAPAAHGANRTGRMFTGDRSGEWVYRALHKAGFANQPHGAAPSDGLRLIDCAITATCHCAPPDNRPSVEEMERCRPWLTQTIDALPVRVLVALGHIAWRSVVREAVERGWIEGRVPRFAHAAVAALAGPRWLVGSYHPSQQNTFTGRLTEPMFDRVFSLARALIEQSNGRKNLAVVQSS